ncbi:LysR family transcriptional regulator [Erythrobacter mangrovi]|uniref:LysR family transcriptional regulator n=1 Tax=Erythrobacter mangrovi TaxID=2739433 RepID=A0A7D4CEL5_9SPHN|nr:LysR family transcriptional regulator [Erythrobacter mangrovi]QKG72569.1 LysR family transcriptional regulator [Erythrobacter mangrovi]
MQQVRYFVTLAKTLNFTRAAEQCNVSQPALTRAIQQLEHEFGGPLFHRERNNTHLSELGRMMLPYLESVEASTRAAKDAAQSARKLENITLTIGAMCTIGPQLVADLIVRFQAMHPDVVVRVIEGEASAMIERLGKGDLHVGLVGVPEELPEQFHQVPVFTEKFVIVLPPDHALATKNAIRVVDLDGLPYVGRSNCEVYRMVTEDFALRGVQPKKVFSSPRDDWVQKMIRSGLGFGFFPEYCVTDPDLVVRPLIEPGYSRTIYLATVRGRPHSPAVGAFVKAARNHTWPVTEMPD